MNSIVEIEMKFLPYSYIIDLSNIKAIKCYDLKFVPDGSIEIQFLRGTENIRKHPDYIGIETVYPKLTIDFPNKEEMYDFKKKLVNLWKKYTSWQTDKEIEAMIEKMSEPDDDE
jgi:hypothetical protein